MKIYYLTSSAFCEVQMNILAPLSKSHSIAYGVIFPVKDSNFTKQEVSNFCADYNIHFDGWQLKRRFRHPVNLFVYDQVIKAIKKFGPDLVVFANFDQPYLNIQLLRLKDIPVIVDMHDVVNHSNTRFNHLTTLGKNILYKNFDNFLTHSRYQGRLLAGMHPDKNVFTIPLALLDFGSLPPRRTTKLNFLFFGNILSYKGLDIFLRAASRVSKTRADFMITVAGRSADFQEQYAPLISGSVDADLRIRFIEASEIAQIFADADYLVLPYRDTTQSGPLMIAYAYNLPVIASKAEGFDEFFIDNTSGYRFSIENEGELDQLLNKCIDQTTEETLQLRQRQKQYVMSTLSMDTLLNLYDQMFESVVNGKRKTVNVQKTKNLRPVEL